MRSIPGIALVALHGCGGDAPGESDPGPVTETPTVCEALELGLPDGSCIRPGIEACGEGFVHDGAYGCEPVLPEESCPPGLMAVPGDARCRPVMPCGAGKWGDIPVDTDTEYVDASYTGGASDGSIERPWTTISQGVDYAPSGAVVAVAEGRYLEDVVMRLRPVRLWGVCPERVEVVGNGVEPAAITIRGASAHATEIHGLGIAAVGIGILVDGTEQVLIDRVWVHDSGFHGVHAQAEVGPTSLELRASLIEQNIEAGVMFYEAIGTLASSLVRDTLPSAAQHSSNVALMDLAPQAMSVRGSVIERAGVWGIFARNGDADIDATVLRDNGGDGPMGVGVGIQFHGAAARGRVNASIVERTRGQAIVVAGANAVVEATIVRDTHPSGPLLAGVGIAISQDMQSLARAMVTVRRSLAERNRESAVFASGSDALVESSVLRDTQPEPIDGFGLGIVGQPSPADGQPAVIDVAESLIERMHSNGVIAAASNITVGRSVVRDTLPAVSGNGGTGIFGHGAPGYGGSVLMVETSVLARNQGNGIGVQNSDATVENCLIADTDWNGDGWAGDGLFAVFRGEQTRLFVHATRIERSARAGIGNFGSFVAMSEVSVRCAPVALNGEPLDGTNFVYEDRGGNTCGCSSDTGPCKVLSTGLAPPEVPCDP